MKITSISNIWISLKLRFKKPHDEVPETLTQCIQGTNNSPKAFNNNAPSSLDSKTPNVLIGLVSSRKPNGGSRCRLLELPYEIRLLIWETVLPGQRVIEIRCRWADTLSAPLLLTSTCLIPVLLYICTESRLFAQKFYHLVYGTTWINFNIDTIYFGYWTHHHHLLYANECREDEHKIQSLAIHPFEYDGDNILLEHESFQSLKEIVLVNYQETLFKHGRNPKFLRYECLDDGSSSSIWDRYDWVAGVRDALRDVQRSEVKVLRGEFVMGPEDRRFTRKEV